MLKFRENFNKRNKNSSVLIYGTLILLIICLVSLLLSKELDEYNNVKISFFDDSLNKENSSVKLIIDNKLIFKSDSITTKSNYAINLKKGKHLIQISTLNEKYILTDTIEIVKYPKVYDLWVKFNYNPPLEEYLKYINENKKIKTNYSAEQIKTVIMNLKNNYKPSDKYFSFTFWEKPMLE